MFFNKVCELYVDISKQFSPLSLGWDSVEMILYLPEFSATWFVKLPASSNGSCPGDH